MYHFNIKNDNFFILFRLNNIYLNILKNQNKMKKKKNTKNWVPVTPETITENKGFPKKPAWLNWGEENPGICIQTKELSRAEFVAGIDPGNEENHIVTAFKPGQLRADPYQEFLKQYMNFPQPPEIRFPSLIDDMRKIDNLNMEEFRKKYKQTEPVLEESTLNEIEWPEPLREFWNPHYRVDINCLEQTEQSKEDMMKALSESGHLFVIPDKNDIRWAIDQLKKGEIVRNSAWPEEKIGIIMKVQPNPSADVKLITEGDVSFQYKFTNEDVLLGTWKIVK